MVSPAEAEATFRTLVGNAEGAVAAAAAAAVTAPSEGRNYKLIIAVVVLLLLAIGGGVWYWLKQGKKGSVAATPAVGKSSRLVAAATNPVTAPGSK